MQIGFSFWYDAPRISGLTAWYDAAYYNASTGVWKDKSGNERDGSQSVVANRPSLVLSGVNNQPVVSFNGSNNGIDLPVSMLFSNPVSIFVVHQILGDSSDNTFFAGAIYGCGNIGGDVNGYALGYNWSNKTLFSQIRQTSSNATSLQSPNNTFTSYPSQVFLHAGVISTTTIDAYFNSVSGSSVHSYGAVPPTVPVATIGYRYNPSTSSFNRHYNGYIAEVIVYNRALSFIENQTIQAYLNRKYNIF